jgi:alpha-amylase/alpha-mannosidase (GH57 family)
VSEGPVRFAFGVHLHQPVGNFDHVFEQHVREAYLPFLQSVVESDFLPISLHLSGPLLEWLESHDTAYLDLLGPLVADGRVELLLGGFYEPVLAALPRADRIQQIGWMREALQRRFGVQASGLWLTERVWQPELAADLAEAGVQYVLVDDRHFLVSGFEREQLHAPFWTESDGRRLAVLPIDERLRYLVPFRPPAETASYLRELRRAGRSLAVLVDDGEKFGGWPGTQEWVFTKGWLRQFIDAMKQLREGGEIRLSTLGEAVREVPSGGLAYLPTASYREMETWSLAPPAAGRLARLERELGDRIAGPEGALVRGAHWHNFLVRYPEANRMHKKMQALSAICRQRGDPAAARRAIGRAQCNDAYWHGVFGGLYLPHLRAAVWHNLAEAERELRRNESLACETVDLDGDGWPEIWIHSPAFSALVSPRRGAAIEEYTVFALGINYADVLTRRREAYHEAALAASKAGDNGEGTPSIHDLERSLRLTALPPVDADDRVLFADRVLPADLSLEAYAGGDRRTVRSWARTPFEAAVSASTEAVTVSCRAPGGVEAGGLTKQLQFDVRGALRVTYRWDAAAFPPGTVFAPEVSVSRVVDLACTPAADVWSFPIATVAKSERGLDETVQGHSLTPRWPVSAGGAEVDIAG